MDTVWVRARDEMFDFVRTIECIVSSLSDLERVNRRQKIMDQQLLAKCLCISISKAHMTWVWMEP